MELASDGTRSLSNLATILDWCLENTQTKVTGLYVLLLFPVANIDNSTETSTIAQCNGCKKCSQIYLTMEMPVMTICKKPI